MARGDGPVLNSLAHAATDARATSTASAGAVPAGTGTVAQAGRVRRAYVRDVALLLAAYKADGAL